MKRYATILFACAYFEFVMLRTFDKTLIVRLWVFKKKNYVKQNTLNILL